MYEKKIYVYSLIEYTRSPVQLTQICENKSLQLYF